jgi:hypothetical protein
MKPSGNQPRSGSGHHMEVKMIKDHANTRALREANKAFKAVETKKARTEYAKAQESFDDNRERLKAERLARETKPKSRPE